jgi:GntR family transcriptional regulator/MocR family aminotransferase
MPGHAASLMQLPISLDPALPATLQEQLFRALQRLILRGVAAPGIVLPGSRQLAAQLGVSRNTVVLAVERLASEGYVGPVRGRGMAVSEGLPDSFLSAPPAMVRSGPRRAADRGGAITRPSRPPAIDFRIGRPDSASFPQAAWRRAVDRQLQHRLDGLFDYPDPAGHHGLRACIASQLAAARGIAADAADIVILSGLPEALDIAATVLSLRGRVALVEKPCYARALAVLRHHGAAVRAIPVDRHGLQVDRLPKGTARLVFVTPSHQFPLGFTLPLERRAALLGKASALDAYVFEDDYDSDFRHEGSPLTALKGLDASGRVIYFGTFAKSLGPGLRLAYVVLPRSLREPFLRVKDIAYRGRPWLEQAALADFIAEGSYQSHIRRSRRLYTRRRDVLGRALRQAFGPVDLSGLGGGMHLAWHLGRNLPGARRIAALAAATGVGVYPIEAAPAEAFGDRRLLDRTLLIGYASVEEAAIEPGVAKLARAIEED